MNRIPDEYYYVLELNFYRIILLRYNIHKTLQFFTGNR